MFLHVSVILFTGMGSGPGECLLRGGGLVRGGGETPLPKETATAADGTHPTGMHSCFN